MAEVDSNIMFDKGAILIQKAGNMLGCSCVVIAKALMIYHHFRRLTPEIEYKDVAIAAAVLGASILKNTGRNQYEDIVLTFHEIQQRDEPDPEIAKEITVDEIMSNKQSYTYFQYFVIQTLQFNIDYVVAHSFVGRYLAILQTKPEFTDIWGNFLELVWRFLSQFYLSERCLQYSAQEIALGCISLAAKVLVVNVSNIPCWNQEVSICMDNKKQQSIFDDLLFVLDVLK